MGQFRVSSQSNVHVSGLWWEETGAPGENPHSHKENIHTSTPRGLDQNRTQNLLVSFLIFFLNGHCMISKNEHNKIPLFSLKWLYNVTSMNPTRGWITFVDRSEWRVFTKRSIPPYCAYRWGQRLIAASCSKWNKVHIHKGIKSHPISNSSHYLLCECEHAENNLRKIPQLNKSWDIKEKRNFQLLQSGRWKNRQGGKVRISTGLM